MDTMRYLRETPMLDFSAKTIQSLIENRSWRDTFAGSGHPLPYPWLYYRQKAAKGSDDGDCLQEGTEEHISQLGGDFV